MKNIEKARKKNALTTKRLRRNLIAISLLALLIKIFIILRIEGFDWYRAGNGELGNGLGQMLDNNYLPPNAWYGADGENYVRGLQGLVVDGAFSKEGKLSYWPAGYPLLMWPILEIARGYFFMALSLIQSILYTLGSFLFVSEIIRTRVSRASYLVALFLAFNPTLSLSTLTVGYEGLVVALSLISTAALINYFLEQKSGYFNWNILVSSVSFSVATFVQPRLIAIALVFFSIWALARYRLLLVVPFLVVTIGIVSVAPALLVFRNQEAQGYAAISTNLGITMRLGAGPQATGGYSNRPIGLVDCPPASGNSAELDRAMVKCVTQWYLKNPGKSLELFWNKARYFWSPWFGPEANGTMARNPWSRYHPLNSTVQTEDGFNMVFGSFGKLFSWAWMLGGLFFLWRGFYFLWRIGDLERLLAIIAGSSFLINLAISMLTIGDHRFRIPSMAMSLFLQAVGVLTLSGGNSVPIRDAKRLLTWPIFQRKKQVESKT